MPPFTVIADYPPFLASLRAIEPAGYDWTGKIRTAQFVLRTNPEAGRPTQDTTMRILTFESTEGHPGLKVFYKIEGTTITLLRGRRFNSEEEEQPAG
ncbi:MAG TPA: hypothetical protein VF710_21105 [Longimicrobium sp.]|jgi:hypothetical protein